MRVLHTGEHCFCKTIEWRMDSWLQPPESTMCQMVARMSVLISGDRNMQYARVKYPATSEASKHVKRRKANR
jgi:hypothetical protein